MNETITNGSNLKFLFSFSNDAKMTIEDKNLRNSVDCFTIIPSCSMLSKTANFTKIAASVAR